MSADAGGTLPDHRPNRSLILAQSLSAVLERSLTEEEAERFQRYLELLLRWNRTRRLTAYRRPEEIILHLFCDSLLFLRVIPSTARKLLDFGTGAGIPGIPLKIIVPRMDLALVEARRNRGSFLAEVLRELGLMDVSLFTSRAEQILLDNPETLESFDVVLARGAGPLSAVIPVSLRFLRPGGLVIMTGPPVQKQPPEIPGDLRAHWRTLPSPLRPDPRRFLVVQKGD